MSALTRLVTLLPGVVTGCAATPSGSPTPAQLTPARAATSRVDATEVAARPAPSGDAPLPEATPDEPAPSSSRGGGAPLARPTAKLAYIGMHIGGGPNDPSTKAPFVAAIEGRMSDLESCSTRLEHPIAKATFGIDLVIGKDGGHPEASNVRTVLSGDDFKKCMVAAFENVEFARPKHGKTKLSYSLRIESR